MSGEDQERFEDYLELEHFIAELQAGHVAHPPQELTPTQARIYRMATLFHAATPGVGEPDPEFATQLQTRLEGELQDAQHDRRTPRAQFPASSKRKRSVSRRVLLTGGAAVAASMTVGAGAEYMAGRMMQRNADSAIVIKVAQPTDWFAVTSVAEMGNSAVKFRVETLAGANLLTGYVLRCEGANADGKQGELVAVSAACTHKGCIVDWSGGDRRFHCPCHGGVFMQDGTTDKGASALNYIEPLPALDVNVDKNGLIHVRIPDW